MMCKNWLRKACSAVISTVMSFSMLAALPNVAQAAGVPRSGDCNGDGLIDKSDVLLLQGFLTGMMPIEFMSVGSDVDGNGSINAKDLSVLKNQLLYHQPTVTMLVYQCGSDLESEAGEATMDMTEMTGASFDNLTLVVETGGSEKWFNGTSTPDANYRLTVDKDGEIWKKISDRPKNMGDSNTLYDFITEEVALHPADHYALVLWNHGGGSIYGVCNDSLANDMLTINEIHAALEKSQVHFDWIGFDACLMGNFETAYALKDYADYMVGSEENESGYGWHYTDFISSWAKNPEMETSKVVKNIVDEMVTTNALHFQIATLAAYDLSKAEAMMDALTHYLADAVSLVQNNGISTLKYQRGSAVEFGDGNYDMVDIGSLMEKLPLEHSPDVLSAMSDMVIYSRQNRKNGATGMSMWFGYHYASDYIYVDYVFPYVGISADYIKYIKALAKAMASGRIVMSEQGARTDRIILDGQAQFRKMME